MRLVRSHIMALRDHRCFSGAELVLIPEGNLGNEAQIVSYDAIRFVNTRIVCQYEHAYGIWTVPGSRKEYVLRLGAKIDENAIFYHDTLIVANRVGTMSPQERLSKVKTEFERQLGMFEAVPMTSKNLRTANTILYSGVANNEGERMRSKREDLAMTLNFGYVLFVLVSHNFLTPSYFY